jgi:signal transduction histidine kinase
MVADQELRSRSLWDQRLESPSVQTGEIRRLYLQGPQQQPLLALVGGFQKQGRPITLLIAEDTSAVEANIASFQYRFTAIAAASLLLLIATQMILVRSGLRPFKHVRDQVRALEQGELRKLSTAVPVEIAPLVAEINHLLQVLNSRLQRSRNALGDLAHEMKKPLTVLRQLEQENATVSHPEMQRALESQTRIMQQIVDRQLKRARLAGEGPVSTYFDIATDVPALIDALQSIYREKNLHITTLLPELTTGFIDREDMLELLGNLLDNACKWAQRQVRLTISTDNETMVMVEDDGPGVDDDALSQLSQRGKRLDESVEGHGLGLAIARDIVSHYNGTLEFGRSDLLGGFRVRIHLPQRNNMPSS